MFDWLTHSGTNNNLAIVFGGWQNTYGVNVDGVTVSASHFARRYGRRIPIVIALSFFSKGISRML